MNKARDKSDRAREEEGLLKWPFVLLLGVQFCFGLSYSAFFLLPKYLTRVFHAHADAIGGVASAALFAGVAAVPLVAAVIDRRSRRSIVLWGSLVNAVSAWGFVGVHAIALPMVAIRAIHGVTYALVFNAVVTLCVDLAPPKRLGQAIGLCGAAGMISNALAPVIGERIADRYGWGWVFWLAGGAALGAALLSVLIREPRHAATNDGEPAPNALKFILEPRRAGAFAGSAANGAAFGAMFTFTQPYALSLGANQVSGFFVGYTASALLVRFFLSSLADDFGRRRVAVLGLALYGGVACLTSFLRPALLLAVGAGLGIAHGLLYPAMNALGVEGVPQARRGAAMTYFWGCFNGGFAFWVSGMGFVAKAYGYSSLFIATGCLVWAALALVPRGRRRVEAA